MQCGHEVSCLLASRQCRCPIDACNTLVRKAPNAVIHGAGKVVNANQVKQVADFTNIRRVSSGVHRTVLYRKSSSQNRNRNSSSTILEPVTCKM